MLIEKALSEAARKALEMEPQIVKFFSEAQRRSYDQGKADALLMVLRRRGLTVTDEQQHQIVTCADLGTLDRWLDRAFSITSVGELLA